MLTSERRRSRSAAFERNPQQTVVSPRAIFAGLIAAVLLAGSADAEEQARLPEPRLPARLHRYAPALPQGLQAALRELDNTPASNPTTDAGATLGRVLFYDKRLSRNNSVACASCHFQRHGFADPRQLSRGLAGGSTKRNAMGLANLRYSRVQGSRPGFFWDERAATLEAQALMPIQDPVEMGMQLGTLERKLQATSFYPPLFRNAFGTPRVTRARISRALAQFLRALVSFNAKYDRAAARTPGTDPGRDFKGFTAQENRGKALFVRGVGRVAEFGCAHCHIPPTFNMPKAFNTGLDLHYADRGLGARNVPSNDPFTENNNGKFKAPSLRNVALTAPYMHDGRFKTLAQVVEHYSGGVHPHENLALASRDPNANGKTGGFRLTAAEKAALVAFLQTLTDKAFVADPRFADPFLPSAAPRTAPQSSPPEPAAPPPTR